MSFLRRSKKESRGALESRYAKLQKDKERLQLKKELQEREREISRLKHPYQEELREGSKRAGGRLARLATGLVKEGIQSYAKTRGTTRRKRTRLRTRPIRRSFTAPAGMDISLSGSIIRADWSGEKNIMNTDFFGEEKVKDLLGQPQDRELVSSKEKKKEIRYI